MEDTGSSVVAEWTVEDVSKKIQQTYNDEVAKKFEGEYKIIYSSSNRSSGFLPNEAYIFQANSY